MRIGQAKVSAAIGGFKKSFLTKYGLQGYKDPHKPAIFFGCYSYNGVDIPTVRKHQAEAIVIWGGTDAMRLPSALYKAKYADLIARDNVYFVAISKHISEDMLKAGIPHVYLPVCPTVFERYAPVPLGNKVYMYSSHRYGYKYGAELLVKIKAKLPGIKFVVGYNVPPNHCPPEDMPGVYSKCFMGVRLTPHDGLSNTVIELGLMGRRCVWNGWLSNAIPWTNVSDVVKAIQREQKLAASTSDSTRAKIARKVRRDLELPKGWLMTEFYHKLARRGRYHGIVLR